MFYCDKCADDNDWPEGFSKSRGKCEVCGKVATCSDRPSSTLPMPKPKFYVFCLGDESEDYRYVRANSEGYKTEQAAKDYAKTIARSRRPVVTNTPVPKIAFAVMSKDGIEDTDLDDIFLDRNAAEAYIADSEKWIVERIIR